MNYYIQITDTFLHEMMVALSLISVMHILEAPFQSMYSKASAQYDHVLIDIA